MSGSCRSAGKAPRPATHCQPWKPSRASMKSRATVFLVLAALLAWMPSRGWTKQGFEPREEEELYGIWANEGANPQEGVLTPGKFEEYRNLADAVPAWSGTERIDARW